MRRLLIIAFLSTFTWISYGQVDPTWLKHWNEAMGSRPAVIDSESRIASADEPGQPLIIHGKIMDPDGNPAPNVIIHSYHRDNEGFDFGANDNSTSTWRIQGWAKTDKNGSFTFHTIRPAPDHLGREGGHIHFTLISNDYGKQWAPKVFFADDKMVTAKQRKASAERGEFGNVLDIRKTDDGQEVVVKFKLKTEADF